MTLTHHCEPPHADRRGQTWTCTCGELWVVRPIVADSAIHGEPPTWVSQRNRTR